jgi:hypothetical protein
MFVSLDDTQSGQAARRRVKRMLKQGREDELIKEIFWCAYQQEHGAEATRTVMKEKGERFEREKLNKIFGI